jgi:hypothetical protein
MGIDPRKIDLRPSSNQGTNTGTTTPDIDRGDGEDSPENDNEEAEEPEGN